MKKPDDLDFYWMMPKEKRDFEKPYLFYAPIFWFANVCQNSDLREVFIPAHIKNQDNKKFQLQDFFMLANELMESATPYVGLSSNFRDTRSDKSEFWEWEKSVHEKWLKSKRDEK